MKTILALLIAVLPACPVRAALISYTFSGTMGGTAGATVFIDAPFTLRVTAETADIVTVGNGASTVSARSARIIIAGVGEGEFSSASMIRLDQGELYFEIPSSGSSFYVAGQELQGISLSDPQAPLFFPRQIDSHFQPTPTSLGQLSLFPVRDVTFSASPVPEPSGAALLIFASCCGMAVIRRRRR